MVNYETPSAYRASLTAKLRSAARTGPWPMAQLQRQVAYDRLLHRLYARDSSWVIKGATALLARGVGVRATQDIDLYQSGSIEDAEQELRAAAQTNIDDWFQFIPGRSKQISRGVRIPMQATIGTTVWVSFHVDLTAGEANLLTGAPDPVGPVARVNLGDTAEFQAFPIADHVADKVAAMYEMHGGRVSSRYKDLVDLVAISSVLAVDAQAQREALVSEFARRNLDLPTHFTVPDPNQWTPGYEEEARRSILPSATTLPEAMAAVGAFMDPILGGSAIGVWDPRRARWAKA